MDPAIYLRPFDFLSKSHQSSAQSLGGFGNSSVYRDEVRYQCYLKGASSP